MFKSDGTIYSGRGLWILCDNGYHKWKFMQCPATVCDTDILHKWPSKMESMRKDVECTFGSLKKRFIILDKGLNFRSRWKCDNIVFCCMVLHNMILSHDNAMDWENVDLSWLYSLDGYDEDWDSLNNDEKVLETNYGIQAQNSNMTNIDAFAIMQELQAEHSDEHYKLRQQLVDTYGVILQKSEANGSNLWPTLRERYF